MLTDIDFQDRRYVLKSRDNDYVSKVESTGFETVKLYFEFTQELATAKVFTYDDLFSPLATTSLGQEFIRGFCGSCVRIK